MVSSIWWSNYKISFVIPPLKLPSGFQLVCVCACARGGANLAARSTSTDPHTCWSFRSYQVTASTFLFSGVFSTFADTHLQQRRGVRRGYRPGALNPPPTQLGTIWPIRDASTVSGICQKKRAGKSQQLWPFGRIPHRCTAVASAFHNSTARLRFYLEAAILRSFPGGSFRLTIFFRL